MTRQATIAIVDDDEPVRDSLDVLIRACGYDTITFTNATDFLAHALESVSCVLLDVRLPDGDGIDVLDRLTKSDVRSPVIMITGHGDVPMAVRAMRIGAADFIEKPFEPDELLAAIERAVERYMSQAEDPAGAEAARERLGRLTPRENQVMHKLILGRQNKVIAHELGLSPRTVEVHRARVMEKTAVNSLSELVRLAIAAGIEPDQTT